MAEENSDCSIDQALCEMAPKETSEYWQHIIEESSRSRDSPATPSTPTRRFYASSSFYEVKGKEVYPTIEDQVRLCREIASQLVDEGNTKSRGREMFVKRVKRASKWVHGPPEDQEEEKEPEVKVIKGAPNLKLILDPREVQTLDKLRQMHREAYNEHNVVSPDVCLSLVRDLQSPTSSGNKGQKLFEKRRQKSAAWVVEGDPKPENIANLNVSTNTGPNIEPLVINSVPNQITHYEDRSVLYDPNQNLCLARPPRGWGQEYQPTREVKRKIELVPLQSAAEIKTRENPKTEALPHSPVVVVPPKPTPTLREPRCEAAYITPKTTLALASQFEVPQYRDFNARARPFPARNL